LEGQRRGGGGGQTGTTEVRGVKGTSPRVRKNQRLRGRRVKKPGGETQGDPIEESGAKKKRYKGGHFPKEHRNIEEGGGRKRDWIAGIEKGRVKREKHRQERGRAPFRAEGKRRGIVAKLVLKTSPDA